MNQLYISVPTVPLLFALIGVAFWAGVGVVSTLANVDKSKAAGRQPSIPDTLVAVFLICVGIICFIAGFVGIIGLLSQTK